jgi:hypothetical protein
MIEIAGISLILHAISLSCNIFPDGALSDLEKDLESHLGVKHHRLA